MNVVYLNVLNRMLEEKKVENDINVKLLEKRVRHLSAEETRVDVENKQYKRDVLFIMKHIYLLNLENCLILLDVIYE